MGLTNQSVGRGAVDTGLTIQKENETDRVIALAGNPNVGKSTVFNQLTGMNQHTGNWPGKTVSNAQGRYLDNILVDIPGTYSLMAHSAEEEVARDFICFGEPDAVVVVCDATALERNLNLVLQTMEITDQVVVCINLMDEAKRKQIQIDTRKLEHLLGVPVAGVCARQGDGLFEMMKKTQASCSPMKITYCPEIEHAVSILEPAVKGALDERLNSRWICLRLLEENESLLRSLNDYIGYHILKEDVIAKALADAKAYLAEHGIDKELLQDKIVSTLVLQAQKLSRQCVTCRKQDYDERDRKIDKFLTSKRTGIPAMLLLLCIIFWITISGANYPSQLLSTGLFWVQDRLTDLCMAIGMPSWLHGMLVLGVYRVLAWVVAVMLPPMAIFFPLFTLLEDLGYLPRIAFNLDKYFKKACACGKQALTMCMGFGCNAAGIVGCRIIDSPRERMIAILTNNFVPCNGRFPPPYKGKQICSLVADFEKTAELIITLNNFEDCADKIKAYRKRHKLTQEEMGAIMGVKYSTLRSWEQKKAKPPAV